jgi:hypothetical protein
VYEGSVMSHPFRLYVGRDTDDCHVHGTAKLGCKINGPRGGGDSEATRLGANFTERDVKKFPVGQYLAKLGAHSNYVPVSYNGKSGLQGDGPGKGKATTEVCYSFEQASRALDSFFIRSSHNEKCVAPARACMP